MAIVTTDSKHYSNIADAIREKAGKTWEATYKPEDMPSGIAEVYTVGYEKGSNDGFMGGHEAGYEMGKQVERNEFWEHALMYEQDWTRRFAGSAWNDNTFRPTKDLKAKGGSFQMFSGCKITDLAGILRECGVTLDVSGEDWRVDDMFSSATLLTTVPYLDLRNASWGNSTLNGLFYGCTALHTIEGLHLNEDGNTTWGSSTFANCTALENLTIYGQNGQNGLNLSWSTKLTHDSLMSVINALQDKSGTGTPWTVTLGSVNLAKLTDAEKAMATQKGWTLA